MPETTPMLCEYSSEMYLKTEALPIAHATPITNMSAVKTHTFNPICIVISPFAVRITRSVCGYDRKKRHTSATHNTHHVMKCAPYLSENQPPIARSRPPGMLNPAASSAAS